MFAKLREAIQERFGAEPIQCPRGWGKVAFQVSGVFLMPLVWLGRTCPISGAESCSRCGYPSNPDTLRLQEQLAVLDELRRTGAIDAGEFAARRTALLALHPPADPAAGLRMAAWILGPLGLLCVLGGFVVAPGHAVGFWLPVAVGAILLALTLSFAVLARRPPADRIADGPPR